MERNPNDPTGTSGRSGIGASTLGAGTDSLGVTGQGADQGATNVGGAGAAGGSWNASQVGGQPAQQGLGDKLSDARDTAADKLSSARDTAADKISSARDTAGDKLSSARDTAGDKLHQVKDAASERFGQVREKASELKSTLADKLDSGAQSLRQQGGGQGSGPQLAVVGADGGSAASASSDQLSRFAAPAADAMEKTAEFLRNGDLKVTLENQVRTNPARTLLIAVGVGYLLGKALRNDR